MASLAVASWALLAWRAVGWRDALHDPALQVAAIGGVTTLASAPLDNWWHVAFGRDAVLWSPPHLAAVAGAFALVVGLCAGLRETMGPGSRTARLSAGVGVIGALQILVLEYDSGVPQFSDVWFLPVATFALCVAVALLDDLLPGRWEPSKAALIYTVLRTATVGLLAGLGFSLTAIPPVLPLLLILGILAALPLGVRLVLLGGIAPLLWWPSLQVQSSVTTVVPADQLPAVIALCMLGGLVVALVHGDLRPGSASLLMRIVLVLGVLGLSVASAPGRAWAHDPGQGKEVAKVPLTVARSADVARVKVMLPDRCARFEPGRVAARRAGESLSGELRLIERPDGRCVASGTVDRLTSGLWFVYADLTHDGSAVEAWLAVRDGESATKTRSLYQPPQERGASSTQVTVGSILVTAVLGILLLVLRLSRRVRRRQT